jgi:RNA polymerase sigma-70 factor (ECF subfamily)
MDRWLMSILHSIWINEVRDGCVRATVDTDNALSFDGEHAAQTHVLASQVIRRVDALPEAQRKRCFWPMSRGCPIARSPKCCKSPSARS